MTASKRLDSLVEFVGGGTPSRKVPEFFTGKIPWVSPKDVKTWEIHDSEEHITQAAVTASTTRIIQPGAVLLVIRSGVLKHSLPVAINRVPVALNQDMKALVCNGSVCAEYLAHYLKANEARLLQHVRGTTADNIPTDILKRTEIPLPPLPEQRRIAAILDTADAIRRKREEGVRLTEELLLSAFLEIFGDPATNPKGWPIAPFLEACDSRLGKMLDAKKQTGALKKPYMRNFNVQWGRLDLSSVFEMDFAEEEREEFRLKHGDVLICEGGAGVGQTAIWHDELSECYFQKSLHRVRPKPTKATSQYISSLMWFLMQSGSILGAISTATIPHLTGEKLKTVRIPLPPYDYQARYETIAYSLASIASKRKHAASEATALFGSLVQRAFRGQLS